MAIMTHAKFHFNWLMLTSIFGIWASEPPLGPGERLKRPDLIGLILATSSQTFHSYFPLFDVDHLKIANCSLPLGNFGQALCIRSCHEGLILTRKSHNCFGIAFIQGDSAGGSKLIEQTIMTRRFTCRKTK